MLRRRDQPQWSDAQRQRLADGLRDTDTGHLLIKFKYSEGLSEEACLQLLAEPDLEGYTIRLPA